MSLQASVPVEYLQDWFDRRQKYENQQRVDRRNS